MTCEAGLDDLLRLCSACRQRSACSVFNLCPVQCSGCVQPAPYTVTVPGSGPETAPQLIIGVKADRDERIADAADTAPTAPSQLSAQSAPAPALTLCR